MVRLPLPAASVRPRRVLGVGLGLLPALLVVLPPLVWLVVAALRSAASPGPELLDPQARGLLVRSLLVGLLATGVTLVLGLGYGWVTARYRLPGRKLLLVASLLPLLLPPFASAHAWSLLLTRDGPLNRTLVMGGLQRVQVSPDQSLWVAALILGFAYWPIVSWFAHFAARATPGEVEDAARLVLPDGSAARWAAWPALKRGLSASLLLVFLLSVADFGTALATGLQTYPVIIVDRFQTERDPGVIARLALPLLAVVLPLVWLQARWLAQAPTAGAAGPPPRLLKSRWSVPAVLGCVLVLALTTGAPLGTLLVNALPWETYGLVWSESSDHFGNTLLTALSASVLTVVLALLQGWVTRGRRLPGLEVALALPYALPASLVGIALIQLLNQPVPLGWPYALYNSLGGLVWLYAVLFYPFVLKTVQPAWAYVNADLMDESRVLGASPWTQFRLVAWPVLKPFAVAGAVIAGLLSAREMDATALIRIPDGDTIAFRIQDYLHFAPGPNVAALCVLVVVLSLLVVGVAALWLRQAEP